MLNFAKDIKNNAFFALENARGKQELAKPEVTEQTAQVDDFVSSNRDTSVQSNLQSLGIQQNDRTFSQTETSHAVALTTDLVQAAANSQTLIDIHSALNTLNNSSASSQNAADYLVSQALQTIMGGQAAPQLVPWDENSISYTTPGGDSYLQLVSSLSDGLANMASAVAGGTSSTTTNATTTKAASSFHINLVWDTSVNSAPSTFKTAIQAAASLLEQYIITPITVNIAVGWGEIGGISGGIASPVAANSAAGGTLGDIYQSYAAVKQELAATATSADDKSVLASLPSTSPYGNVYYDVAGAQAKAFGLTSATNTALDGLTGFATNWPSSDLIAAALHEISHAMGRNSGWAAPSYGSDITVLDLMRFSAPGTFAADGTKASASALQYFSVDGGKTVLAHYALTSDLGDWYTDSLTSNDPNNAYLSSGSNALTNVDLRVLDAMGFTLVGSSSPVPSTPDLVIASITPAASSVVKGSTLNFSYNVSDIGAAAAGASTVSIAVDGVVVGTAQVGALASNGSTTLTGSVNTSALAIGQHTVTLTADSGSVVNEGNESNNSNFFNFAVTAATNPDLVISSLSTAASSVVVGNSLSFNYTIADNGTAAASASTTTYAIDGVVKGSLSTASLAAGASVSGSGSVSTTGLSLGTHTLSLVADANNVVAESNEANNSLSQSFTVTASAPSASADLSISGLSAYSKTVTQGEQLIFAYTLKNSGTGSAAASKVGYSVDTLPTASSNGGTNSFGALTANSWNSSPIDFVNTSNLSVGTHTLYVTSDVANSVAETNESNNTSALTFTVLGKSDFTVSAATTPDTVKAGGTFKLNYTVTNTGQGNPNYYTYAAVYFDGRANAVSYDIIKNLNPGASQSITDIFSTYGVAKGTHTLTITSDALNFVNESNELNNSKTITFKIV